MAEKLLTLAEIAKELKVEVHRIRYVIDTNDIEETSRVGNARLFGESAVKRITSEIGRIGQWRSSFGEKR